MGLLYGRAGRLNTENGGFRPGQSRDLSRGNATVRAVPGRLSAISVFLCKSVLYGAFVWARRALNRPKRRFPARAGGPAPLLRRARTRARPFSIPRCVCTASALLVSTLCSRSRESRLPSVRPGIPSAGGAGRPRQCARSLVQARTARPARTARATTRATTAPRDAGGAAVPHCHVLPFVGVALLYVRKVRRSGMRRVDSAAF
jgi:hypothetical protein